MPEGVNAKTKGTSLSGEVPLVSKVYSDMTERELIKKLKTLRAIRPNKDWTIRMRANLLKKIEKDIKKNEPHKSKI